MTPTNTYERVVYECNGDDIIYSKPLTIRILNYDKPIRKTDDLICFCKVEILDENGAEWGHAYFPEPIPEHLVKDQFNATQSQLQLYKNKK